MLHPAPRSCACLIDVDSTRWSRPVPTVSSTDPEGAANGRRLGAGAGACRVPGEVASACRWERIYRALYSIHLGRLSGEQRRALSLVEVEGDSYQDAAHHLGISRSAVRRAVFEGRSIIHARVDPSFRALRAMWN